MTDEPKTVKCRIALAVDKNGAWRVWDSMAGATHGLTQPARYWVDVEVPLPSVPVIRASATEAGEGGA